MDLLLWLWLIFSYFIYGTWWSYVDMEIVYIIEYTLIAIYMHRSNLLTEILPISYFNIKCALKLSCRVWPFVLSIIITMLVKLIVITYTYFMTFALHKVINQIASDFITWHLFRWMCSCLYISHINSIFIPWHVWLKIVIISWSE